MGAVDTYNNTAAIDIYSQFIQTGPLLHSLFYVYGKTSVIDFLEAIAAKSISSSSYV